jgi:hypothetical protein
MGVGDEQGARHRAGWQGVGMPLDGDEPLDTGVPLDTTVPHIARVYDYWLGGKDNFAADRELAEKFMAADPSVTAGVRSNRAFLGRAVHYLVTEAGIRQFLDIGTGIPAADNTHEVAQRVDPSARVVYVDNDPIVLIHARALLASHPAGATDYIDADLRDVGTILAAAARTLDFSQPVAVMLIGVLHCIPDEDYPGQLVATLMEAAAPGSYLALSTSGRRHPRGRDGRRGRDDESGHGRVDHLPHPGAGRRVLYWPGPGRAGSGLHPAVAPGARGQAKPLPGWVGVAVKPAAGQSRSRAGRRNTG